MKGRGACGAKAGQQECAGVAEVGQERLKRTVLHALGLPCLLPSPATPSSLQPALRTAKRPSRERLRQLYWPHGGSREHTWEGEGRLRADPEHWGAL